MFKRTRPTSSLDDFYFYNADDRMIQVDMLEGIESVSQFEYDAMGRRLISTDNDGNQTLYYYDGIRVILEKTKPSGSGTWNTSKVYTLQEGAIGFIISSRDTATGDDTWYHYDRLGTVMNLTDATGAVTATYSQDAFGNVLSGSSDGFHLTTKDYNSTIGLYYFYQRWYDPVTGRFLRRDPLPTLFPYTYCSNNPNYFIDVMGLEDTIKICFYHVNRELVWQSPWYNRGSTYIWRLTQVVQDPLGLTCQCHWLAIGIRETWERVNLFLVTTILVCPENQNDCETDHVEKSRTESYETEIEKRYFDIPLPHPFGGNVTVGIVGDKGQCFCPFPSLKP